jgi:manganese oxidase
MPSLKLAWSFSGPLAGFCCGVDKWTGAPGTAGTWMYHNHAMGNPMIGAEDKGLFGTLVVNPASGKVPALIDGKVVDVDIADIKREFILWTHETTFWGQELNHIVKGDKEIPLWTNPTVGARLGEKIRFHIIGIGTAFHTFHLHVTAGSSPARPA